MVGEVPARHVLLHILLVHDLAIFVEILPALTGHSQLALTAIIFVEQGKGVSSCDDARTLIVQDRLRVALQQRDGVSMRRRETLERKCRCKTAQGRSYVQISSFDVVA